MHTPQYDAALKLKPRVDPGREGSKLCACGRTISATRDSCMACIVAKSKEEPNAVDP